MLPFFPTVLACCVRKSASTVFHPTLSLAWSLKQAKILFLSIKNTKKDRINFTDMYFKERQQGTSGTPFSSFSHTISYELSALLLCNQRKKDTQLQNETI